MQKPRITSAVLVEHEGKFLLAKRNKKNCYGSWVIPGGGVNFGETTKEAALREIKEETNIDVDIYKFIGYKEVINVPGNYHSITFYYLANPKHTNINVSDCIDVSQAKFFSIDEIKKLNILESVEWVLKKAELWK